MSRQRKLLIVDSDAASRGDLAAQLRLHAEFETEEFGFGAAALNAILHDYFDAILLEVQLSDMDGPELCRLMRREGVSSPIIMIGGGESGADEILALNAGANDYVIKPVRIGILLARMRAQIRLHEVSEDPVFPIGRIRFRPGANQLYDPESKRKIRLTQKETAILKYLYRAGNRAVSWDSLLQELRHQSARLTPQSLESYVDHLQRKIAEGAGQTEFLVVDDGGLRLVR